MRFDVVIGNPPYNDQLYRKFLELIPSLVKEDGTFDLLFPVYIYTRKKCMKVLKDNLKLECVDMTPGHHFSKSISGSWVTRIKGKLGKTDTFDIVFPDGNITHGCTLNDINPSSAIFIEDMVKKNITPLCDTDRVIANKVLIGNAPIVSHKEGYIEGHFCYLSPVIRRMTKIAGDEYPGILHLRTMTENSKDTKNGFYISTETKEEAEHLSNLYGRNKLFVYLFYLTASDSIYADQFIKRLPHPDHIPALTDSECERINEVLL